MVLKIEKVFYISCFFISILASLSADVKSTSGNLRLDVENDGQTEAVLNSTGLGIGVVAQANLHVAGNGIVSEKIAVGGAATENSFHLYGTISLTPLSSTGNISLTENSLLLVDTSSLDGIVTLPRPSEATGRILKVKKLSRSGNLFLTSGGNLIELGTTLVVTPDSSADMASIKLVSDGDQWWVLSYSGPSSEVMGGDNLVVSYKLNETTGGSAADDSGNSRTGTLLNSHDFSGNTVTGVELTALEFDEEEDGVNYNHGASLFSNAYSWSLWVNSNIDPDGTPSYDTAIPNDEILGLNWSSGNTNWKKTVFHKQSDGSFVNAQLSTDIATNTWYHISGTWDGATLKAYLNGSLEASEAATTIMTHSGNLNLANPGSEPSPTTSMDHFQFFDRALSDNEVYTLFMAGTP